LYLAALAQLLVGAQKGKVKTIYLSDECSKDFGKMRPDDHGPNMSEIVDIRGIRTLESLIRELWPDLFSGE